MKKGHGLDFVQGLIFEIMKKDVMLVGEKFFP